jgi:hypothetical protein
MYSQSITHYNLISIGSNVYQGAGTRKKKKTRQPYGHQLGGGTGDQLGGGTGDSAIGQSIGQKRTQMSHWGRFQVMLGPSLYGEYAPGDNTMRKNGLEKSGSDTLWPLIKKKRKKKQVTCRSTHFLQHL